MKPTFSNRPNQMIISQEGESYWISRSVALVGQVCVYSLTESKWYILLIKRGTGTPDYQGYWCLPCGYLDWDETLTDGFLREVYEEAGVYLPALSSHADFGYSDSGLTTIDYPQEMPWAISDPLHSGKQNISMHFAVFFTWKGETLPTLSNAHCEPDEVDALQWTPIEEAGEMSLAFNHQKRINIMGEQLQHRMRAHVDYHRGE